MHRVSMRMGAAVFGLALISLTAWAFPWDTDMVDAVFKRAYAWKMLELPEGAVSRTKFRTAISKDDPATIALRNPHAEDGANVAEGARLFSIYCATCHGTEGKGGAEVTKGGRGEGHHYPVPPPTLSGSGSIPSKRADGQLFAVIRHGSTKMPSYSYAMSDPDIWNVVAYIRTLDGTEYTPAPAAAPEGGAP